MSADQFTRLLGAIVSLLQVLIWPLLIVFVLLYLGKSIKDFIEKMSKFTIKAGNVEIDAEKQIAAAAALGLAVARENKDKPEEQKPSSREIVKLVNKASTPQASKQISEASILWVDDHPENQQYERNALKVLGMRFTTSLSTEEALANLYRNKYDVIISDMGRPPDPQAGYTLLKSLPELNKNTPFIIYSFNGSLPEHRQEASSRGAYGSTSQIQEVFEMVLEALQKK